MKLKWMEKREPSLSVLLARNQKVETGSVAG